MMTSPRTPKQNQILAALSPLIFERLLPDLELVCISVGEGIYDPGVRITHLYFPIDCIAASIGELASGEAYQTSLTGNEGIIGISFLLGSENGQARTVAISPGTAFRIKASRLKKEFDSGGQLQHLLLRFTHALLAQTAHSVVAARHYSIKQQLSTLI